MSVHFVRIFQDFLRGDAWFYWDKLFRNFMKIFLAVACEFLARKIVSLLVFLYLVAFGQLLRNYMYKYSCRKVVYCYLHLCVFGVAITDAS